MKTFKLTYNECKAIIDQLGRDELERFLESLNDQPEFLKFMGELNDWEDIEAILEGGCASGAYMPAVTYNTALQCMSDSEAVRSVEDQLEDMNLTLEFNPSQENFSGFCSKLCALAVEVYCFQFEEVIDVLAENR